MAPAETELQVDVEAEAPTKLLTENPDGEEEAEEEAPLTPPDEPKFIDVQPLLPAP
jgi:hypothetical protein